MDTPQRFFFGFGYIAYAVAMADGKVQEPEHEIVHAIVAEGIKSIDSDFDFSDLSFDIMEQEHLDAESSYQWGMDAIKQSNYTLNDSLIKILIDTLEKVGEAFPPTSAEEHVYIERFKEDVSHLV